MFKKNKTSTKNPISHSRLIVSDCYGIDHDEDDLEIVVEFFCVNHLTGKNDAFDLSFPNNTLDASCNDFFDFLDKSKIHFEDYEELLGLVLDASVYYDEEGKLVLRDQKLIARPPKR